MILVFNNLKMLSSAAVTVTGWSISASVASQHVSWWLTCATRRIYIFFIVQHLPALFLKSSSPLHIFYVKKMLLKQLSFLKEVKACPCLPHIKLMLTWFEVLLFLRKRLESDGHWLKVDMGIFIHPSYSLTPNHPFQSLSTMSNSIPLLPPHCLLCLLSDARNASKPTRHGCVAL